MKFSIVTPSFRSSNWLKLCIASVADQQGVELEHIVQDSCSDDGTQDWLPRDPRVKAFIEKDGGMYDAINRGYRRAQGDILAYLNCDEQYLPGALKAVREFFEKNPRVEVALAGAVVVDGSGNYMCHRPALKPHPQHIWFRFSQLTAAIFIRRRVIHERGIFFDPRWRVVGDFHWALALLRNKVPMKEMDGYTSVFADTGDNLCLSPRAIRETRETRGHGPGLGAGIKTSLDCAPSSAPPGRRSFFPETLELLLLYAAKSGPARAAGGAQTHGNLVETDVTRTPCNAKMKLRPPPACKRRAWPRRAKRPW